MNIKWIMADGTCTIWFGYGLLAVLCEYNNVWLSPLKNWKFLDHICTYHLLYGICQTRTPKIVQLALDVYGNLNLLCCKLRCVCMCESSVGSSISETGHKSSVTLVHSQIGL